jgi:hypothetical protein
LLACREEHSFAWQTDKKTTQSKTDRSEKPEKTGCGRKLLA